MKYPLRTVCVKPRIGDFVATGVFDDNNEPVDLFSDIRRIVACLNYCEEITTEQLERACDAQPYPLESHAENS